jgi:hypothetical protein
MDTSANIAAAVFAAHLKCPTKAYLTALLSFTFLAQFCNYIFET